MNLYIQSGTRGSDYRSSTPVTEVDFTANPPSERCDRCHIELSSHVMQLVDDGDVLDCTVLVGVPT